MRVEAASERRCTAHNVDAGGPNPARPQGSRDECRGLRGKRPGNSDSPDKIVPAGSSPLAPTRSSPARSVALRATCAGHHGSEGVLTDLG